MKLSIAGSLTALFGALFSPLSLYSFPFSHDFSKGKMKRTTLNPAQESQSLIGSTTRNATVPPANATNVVASSRNSSNNPITLAKMILQKVYIVLTDEDGDDNDSIKGCSKIDARYVLQYIKDVLIGLFYGVVTVSFFIFLDRKYIVPYLFCWVHPSSFH